MSIISEPQTSFCADGEMFSNRAAKTVYWLGRYAVEPANWGVSLCARWTQRSWAPNTHGRLPSIQAERFRRVCWFVEGVACCAIGLIPLLVGGPCMMAGRLANKNFTYIQPNKEPNYLEGRIVRIATFNLGFLPEFVTVFNQLRPVSDRADQFIDYVNNRQNDDWICVQELFNELFHKESIKKIVEQCKQKYPYIIFDTCPRTLGMDSGLAIFSKYPLKEPTFWKFKDTFEEDALSNKGILGVKIQVKPDRQVVVFTTHFQSGYSEKAQNHRAACLVAFRELYQTYGKGAQDIITQGDFNLTKWENRELTEEWKAQVDFFERLNKASLLPKDASTCWDKQSPYTMWDADKLDQWKTQTNQIDQILAYQTEKPPLLLSLEADREWGICSDHLALRATMELQEPLPVPVIPK
ncbi:MAG: hypothetical protein KGJ02_08240 [Verrucomicrobiota bacterium]|nr:hypothetical protein [Verrucomicrobiota bacterium]